MSRVLFIRHARTAWNEEKRIQGRQDIPLSEAGRRDAESWRLPARFCSWPVFVSPLARALETARLLGCGAPVTDARLMEMDYGSWEGLTSSELETRYGAALGPRTPSGIDFRPDGGESPRELRRRLDSWLDEVRASRRDVIAVTHKGIIRMALAMATGWDLVSKAPVRLRWDCGHLFTLRAKRARGGAIEVAALNVALAPS